MSLSEILLIIMVALIVFGPQKLPQLAQQLGKLIGYLQHYNDKMKSTIDQQLQLAQLEQNNAKAADADQQYQNTVSFQHPDK